MVQYYLEQREQTYRVLKDSPSLKSLLPEVFLESYQSARKLFLKKSNLPVDTVLVEPPFTIKQVLDFDYLP